MNKPKALDEQTAKASDALQKFQKKQETKLITGEDGQKTALNQGFTRKATVYFKNNNNCEYHLDAACTKVLIESCNNCTIKLSGRINTEVVEVWKCENTVVIIDSKVKTLQADLSKNLHLKFEDKSHFNQVIWAGIRELKITLGDQVHESGVEKINREEIPDFKEDFDQFIVRNVKGRILEELIVRLQNGFPTTEREASAFDAQKEKNDKLYEAHVKQLLTSRVSGVADKLDQLTKNNAPKKVGRNDPCTCGSGKKFKKCCEGKTGLGEDQLKGIQEAKEEITKMDEEQKKEAEKVKAAAQALLPVSEEKNEEKKE